MDENQWFWRTNCHQRNAHYRWFGMLHKPRQSLYVAVRSLNRLVVYTVHYAVVIHLAVVAVEHVVKPSLEAVHLVTVVAGGRSIRRILTVHFL